MAVIQAKLSDIGIIRLHSIHLHSRQVWNVTTGMTTGCY